MQVRASKVLDLTATAAASVQVTIPFNATPQDCAEIRGAPGGLTVYVGEVFSCLAGAVTLPTQVDWQLLAGTGPCDPCEDRPNGPLKSPLWETVPVAAGTTFLIATAAREGALWHAGVAGATTWLLRARTTHALGLQVTLVFRPWASGGCCASWVPIVAAGSAIG